MIYNTYKPFTSKGSALLLFVLLTNFILRLIIFYNTTLFYYSDWRAYLDGIENIKKGIYPPLQFGEFTFLNSYIGYFFKYILGNIDFYFIFNCLMGTVATFIVYQIMRNLGASKKAGVVAVILLTLYPEFMVFSSIFYTVIIMVLILLIVILFSIKLIKETNTYYSILYIFLITVVTAISLFFKRELIYFWVIPLMTSLFILRKDYRLALILIILSLLLYFSILTISRKIILKDNALLTNRSFLLFEAHTWFGGDGGKAQIIYPEKKLEYQREFEKYCQINNIVNPSKLDEAEFKNAYVKKFVINHPLSWISLQAHKFFWEYGVLPESHSFRILMTGLTKKHTILTAVILVLPIIINITFLIFTFNFKALCYEAKYRVEFKFLFLLFFYYIIATVFYYCYSERYRIPVMVSFVIPLLAYNLTEFKIMNLIRNKKELFIKIFIFLIFLSNWSYEAYVITYKNQSRYFKTLDEVIQYNPIDDKSIQK